MTFEKQIQQITTVPCIADCAAMAVVKVNKKSKKNSKKGTGKKPRPVPLKERPQLQRCPFSISPKLATKFSAMLAWLLHAVAFKVFSLQQWWVGQKEVKLICVCHMESKLR